MPTLQDVANQIKDDLDQIKASTALSAARIDTQTQHLDADAAMLSQGLFAIWEVEKLVATLLSENAAQNNTIICWLQTQADLQCRMLRRLNTLIEIETVTRDRVIKLEKIFELVHPRETLEVQLRDATEAKIAECCPPEPETPEPCYEPCVMRDIKLYQPEGQDWQPANAAPPGKKRG